MAVIQEWQQEQMDRVLEMDRRYAAERHPKTAVTQITDLDLYWLAGFLEGEGCFGIYQGRARKNGSRALRACIQAKSNDHDVISKAAELLGAKLHGPHQPSKATALSQNPFWQINLGGGRVVPWLHRLRPLMGTRRREAIDKAIRLHNTSRWPDLG